VGEWFARRGVHLDVDTLFAELLGDLIY